MNNDWQRKAQEELEVGREAQKAGFAGRARVCARRAAGIAAQAYLRTASQPASHDNYYTLIKEFSRATQIPRSLQRSAERLCMRVDENYQLPVDIDLLEDAVQLIRFVSDHEIDTQKE